MGSQNRFFNLFIAVWHAAYKTVDSKIYCTLVLYDSIIQSFLTRMCTNTVYLNLKTV